MLLPQVDTTMANITILSIFKIILFEFDYRTVNVFTDRKSNYDDDDVAQEMMNILMGHSKATHILTLETNLSERIRCEEPILNVLFVANDNKELVEAMKLNIYPKDISLILVGSVERTEIESNIQSWMQVSNKVLMINNSSVLALDPLRNHKVNIMPLVPFHRENATAFIRSYINSSKYLQREKRLKIFFQFLSPRSMVTLLRTGVFHTGVDGSIAEVLLKKLNATGVFVSDVNYVYPSMIALQQTLKANPPNADTYEHFKITLTNNRITDYNSRITDAADFHMSPYIVQEDLLDKKLNLTTEPLYPHERDCVVVIVPKQERPEMFLEKVVRNGDIQSLGIAMLTLIIARILIERASYRKWFGIALRTLGILFNQAVIRNRNFLESSWTNVVKGFSTIATIALSAIIYNNLVNDKYDEINTIDELIASNLTVVAPNLLETQLKLRLSINRPQLLQNIIFRSSDVQSASIFAHNFSFAYISRESSARNYLKVISSDGLGGRMGRIMTETLYCNLNSYRIDWKSEYKNYVEDFLLRVFENGLYTKHLQWATSLLNAILKPPSVQAATSTLVLTLSTINSVFVLYLIGVAISCVIFSIENIYVKCKRRS